MDNWYVSNAAMTLATVLATIPVLFSDGTCRYGVRALFHVAGIDVKMRKSFSLKKTLYDTVVQIAERFEPNTTCTVGIPHNTAIYFHLSA